jgi:transcriptional regulator with XRE-family HTH domain
MKLNSAVVRKIRRDRAWSQEHLASVAGVSLRTIQRVEADGSGSLETNMALASALGVPTIELVLRERPSVPAAAGAWVGIVSGTLGALLGLAFAWSGFIAWPLDAQERGTSFGLMGALSGLILAFVGVVIQRVRQSRYRPTDQGEI